jgi:hypothetical protein
LKQAFQHILVYFLAGIVWVSSTGLSLHRVYCYCKGESTTNLIYFAGQCEEKKVESTPKSCCKGAFCQTAQSEEKHRCNSHSSQYFKANVQLLLTSNDFEIHAPIAVSVSFFQLNERPVSKPVTALRAADLPPPPFGKALLPWVQSFLC